MAAPSDPHYLYSPQLLKVLIYTAFPERCPSAFKQYSSRGQASPKCECMSSHARSSSSCEVSAQVRTSSCPSWRLLEAPCAGQVARRSTQTGLSHLAMHILLLSHALNPKDGPRLSAASVSSSSNARCIASGIPSEKTAPSLPRPPKGLQALSAQSLHVSGASAWYRVPSDWSSTQRQNSGTGICEFRVVLARTVCSIVTQLCKRVCILTHQVRLPSLCLGWDCLCR